MNGVYVILISIPISRRSIVIVMDTVGARWWRCWWCRYTVRHRRNSAWARPPSWTTMGWPWCCLHLSLGVLVHGARVCGDVHRGRGGDWHISLWGRHCEYCEVFKKKNTVEYASTSGWIGWSSRYSNPVNSVMKSFRGCREDDSRLIFRGMLLFGWGLLGWTVMGMYKPWTGLSGLIWRSEDQKGWQRLWPQRSLGNVGTQLV